MVAVFVLCVIATGVLVGLAESYIHADMHNRSQDGASVIGAIFIPLLVLNTFLFVLKVYLLATSPAYMERDTFVWRFMKEYALIHALYATFS